MKFVCITSPQLLILALLMSVLTATLVALNSWYLDYRMLPRVHVGADGTCIKVENLENGHAFNCNDVNVVLRQYHTVTSQ
jgi:hypothetical protein